MSTTITRIFSPSMPIMYVNKYNKLTGKNNVKIALFISYLLTLENYTADEDKWFSKTAEEIANETGLSRKEQVSVRKKLCKLNIINEKISGLPGKLHFKLNHKSLQEALNNVN